MSASARKTPSKDSLITSSTLLDDEPDLMIVWGSGGTLRRMGEHLDLDLTLLGIDVQHGRTVHHDLNEQGSSRSLALTRTTTVHGPFFCFFLPWVSQGFLIGREIYNSLRMCFVSSVMPTFWASPRLRNSLDLRRSASTRAKKALTQNFKQNDSSKFFKASARRGSFVWLNSEVFCNFNR